jgi:tight adherence protein C
MSFMLVNMSVTFVTFVTFLVLSGTVLALGLALRREAPAAQRVRQLVGERAAPARSRESGSLLGRLVATIGRYGIGGDRSSSQRLSVAGFRGPNAAAIFLGTRTLISFGPALVALVPAVSAGRPLGNTVMTAGVAFVAGHLLANLWLKRRMQRRERQITRALPDALDLMVVCLESGLGLNATVQKVGDERATVDDVLGQEFAQVASDLRDGRPRADSLRALGTRNGSDDLKALTGLIIQSDKLGASMSKTLRTHADLLRTRRRQRAEEAARKLPIKVLFPLALCILPALFAITVGPAVLKIGDLSTIIAKR